MEALDLSKKDEKKEKKLKDFIFNYLKYTTLGFEEWMSLNQNIDSMIQTNKALAKKLLELKELLKECKPYIALYIENNKYIGFTPEIANLLQRIKEVLK